MKLAGYLQTLSPAEQAEIRRAVKKAQLRALKRKQPLCREDLIGIILRYLGHTPIRIEDLTGKIRNPFFREKRRELILHLVGRGAEKSLIAKVFSIHRQTVIRTVRKHGTEKKPTQPKENHGR